MRATRSDAVLTNVDAHAHTTRRRGRPHQWRCSMKRNVISHYTNKIRLALLVVAAPAALLVGPSTGHMPTSSVDAAAPTAAAPAFQTPPRPWTAVGSTGAVDEDSLNIFAFGTTDLLFKAGGQGSVLVARYNVTNTFDNNANPNKPGWTTFEMGSQAPINTTVEGRLFTIKACGMAPVLICTARNHSNDHPCAKCEFNSSTIDFTSSLYYVEVKMDRSAAMNTKPKLFTLRVF